jgi:hypothetical protein
LDDTSWKLDMGAIKYFKKKPPRLTPGTGLLFEVVFLFRNYTAGLEEIRRGQDGGIMPAHGHPFYDVAAEFVFIATGDKFGDPQESVTIWSERACSS